MTGAVCVCNGGQLSRMTVTTVTETADGQTTTETHTVDLTYDASGNPQTMTYDGVTYYYTVNIQGDVSGIVDENGNVLVRYYYQGYGITYYSVPAGDLGKTLLQINPLTYRGYVYDKETKLYYLQSRYYNRTSGRFINADSLVTTGQGLLGNNMFAYCLNNPANGVDPTGYRAESKPFILFEHSLPYINSQKDPGVGELRFGVSTVAHSGCAAVATYNALVSMGDGIPFDLILTYYNINMDDLVLLGFAGTLPHTVVNFFEMLGYTVIVTDSLDGMDIYSQTADACILWYMFETDSFPGLGGHYVEYSRTVDGYIGRNTGGGTVPFAFPSEFAYRYKRFYAVGIYIYK